MAAGINKLIYVHEFAGQGLVLVLSVWLPMALLLFTTIAGDI